MSHNPAIVNTTASLRTSSACC